MMTKGTATAIRDYLRDCDHQPMAFVEHGDAFACAKIYCVRDPGGVLRAPTYTWIQIDLPAVDEAARILGSQTVDTAKGRLFAINARVVDRMPDGAAVILVAGLRGALHSVGYETIYVVPLPDGRAVTGLSAHGLRRSFFKVARDLVPKDKSTLPHLPILLPPVAHPPQAVRYDPGFLIARSEVYQRQLEEVSDRRLRETYAG